MYKKLNSYYLLAATFLFTAIYQYIIILPYVHISTFLVRDIRRARIILEEGMVFFGPDTTSGYYLPGPFYSLLLTPIVFFTENIKWVLLYQLGINLLCFLRLSLTLKRSYSISPWITFILCSSTPFMYLNIFWANNSSLIPGLVALFIAQVILFLKNRKNIDLFLIGLLIGLAVQIHGSLVMLLVIFLLSLFFFDPKSKIPKAKFMAISTLGFLIPIIPFLVRLNFSPLPYHNSYTHNSYIYERLLDKFLNLDISQYLNFSAFRVELLIIYILSSGIALQYLLKKKNKLYPLKNTELKKILVILAPLFILLFNILFAPTTPRYGFFLVFISKIICLIVLFQNEIWKRVFQSIAFLLILSMGFDFFNYSFSQNFSNQFYKKHNDLNLKDSTKICTFLNKKKITRSHFIKSTYEILDRNQMDSLWLLKYCLKNKENSYTSSLSEPFYIVVAKSIVDDEFRFNSELSEIGAQIPEVSLINRLDPSLKTDNYMLYEVTNSTKNILGNLTDSYMIDPATLVDTPVEAQLSDEIQIKNFNLRKFSLCDSNYFCDLYVFYKFTDGRLKLSIFSRLFQSRWGIPPLTAFSSKMTLNYICDGENLNYQWPMSFGALRGQEGFPPTEQNHTNYMPAYFDTTTSCRNISLNSLSLEDVIFRHRSSIDKKDRLSFKF